MKTIGFDARLYGLNQRGLGRYVKMLLDEISSSELDFNLVVFLNQSNYAEFVTNNPRIKKVKVNCHWYTLWEQIIMAYYSWRYNLDVFHVPHFNAPILARGKIILTIHDLTINRFPDSRATTRNILVYYIKLGLYRLLLLVNLFRATKVITIAKFTASEIIHDYPWIATKIIIIYEAVGLTKQEPIFDLLPVITKPYLIYVGAAYPHKNLDQLIKGFQIFNHEHNYQLVLVGRHDFFYQRLIKSVSDSDVIFTGYLSDQQLLGYLRQASLFVFPSLYEGFGLPALEAQSQNLIASVSDIPIHREILANSVQYFSNTPESMALAWQQILNNQVAQNNYRQQATINLQRFSQEKMAQETLAVYKSV